MNYKVEKLARDWGVSRNTIYRWIRDGKLQAGTRGTVFIADIAEFTEKHVQKIVTTKIKL